MDFMILQTVTIALALGVMSYTLARKLKMPAVLFYLLCGLLVGPVGFSVIEVGSLGKGLLVLVEIAVAVILFEGGLSLSSHGFKSESAAIRRILIITIPLTGIGAAVLAHFVLDVSWKLAAFFGALIVVTGPTVIGSLLKSVNLTRRLEVILNWESIWGDVIGVLLSAVALELIIISGGDTFGHLAQNFFLRIVNGALIGGASGFLLARLLIPWVIKLRDPALPGLVAVAFALGTFFAANYLLESSGALAVAVAGFFLSYLKPETLHEIRHFKEQLASLFISTLFVLLSAYINPLELVQHWPKMLFVAFVLGAVVRPASVFLALAGTEVSRQERTFIAFTGPRGIIAMATVSYGSLLATAEGNAMDLLMNLTFAIIFFSGATATFFCRPLAKLLKVYVPLHGSGILIAGVNAFSSALADFANRYVPVVVMDRETRVCLLSERLKHEQVCLDLLDSEVYEKAVEEGFGRLMTMTRNDALNELIAQQAAVHFDPASIYRVQAGSFDELIIRQSSFTSKIAFADEFHSPRVISQLEEGTARLEVRKADELDNPAIVPLLEIVDEGRGVRILTPGQTPEHDTFCFVPQES